MTGSTRQETSDTNQSQDSEQQHFRCVVDQAGKDIRIYWTPGDHETPRGVREKYQEWGPGHPLWESRVLGNFPSADPYGLIPLSWIELAKIREETMESSEPVEAGVDVAEGGENETVVCVRRGGHVIAAQGWSARDARGPVAEFLKRHGVRNVKVDKVGPHRARLSADGRTGRIRELIDTAHALFREEDL